MSAPPPALDALLRGIHECPGGLTCRPGRGVLYPAPPEGAPGPRGVDVLFVGWNPRIDPGAPPTTPPFAAWRRAGEESLRAAQADRAPLAQDLRALLPPPWTLASQGVMRTYLWKWPTRFKTGEGESLFYAQRCMKSHFDHELPLLRPRALVTFHAEAADEMARRAASLGVEVREPHPRVRRGEASGWSLPTDAWGWPMGLLLLRDAAERYHADTVAWGRKALAHLLGAPS